MENETEPLSLGEALNQEMNRVRDEIMPAYIEVGRPGMFAVALMRNCLDRAQKAIIEVDVITMLAMYKALREFTT